ncbi:MAG: histidine phosphatase family protein [Bacteroidales bacterium]|nr:histidine phosphatase family protein [Bacteroidales bacterium]
MFRRLIVSLLKPVLAALLFALPICAAETYTPLPKYLDGSMMPIDFSECSAGSWIPDSLRPVYATYVSRHGARYLSGPGKTEKLEKLLQNGVNNGNLSETGEAFFCLLKETISANTGNWGDLSPLGIEEQKIMGRRIFGLLSPLHQGAPDVKAISSYVPRCVMTMYEFTGELLRHNDSISVATDEGHQYNSLLCCFIADKEYAEYRKNGDWKHVYNDFLQSHVSASPARRLFSSTDLSDKELREYTMDMYQVLKGNRAAGLPAPTTQWMSEKEYEGCWEADNLAHYLRNSVNALTSLPAVASAPLAFRLIRDIDKAATQLEPQPVMNGYFGHAETLLPLLSLLKIQGCFALPLNYESLSTEWKVQNITPLGANIFIMLSVGPSGQKYASIQLNGRTVSPISGKPEFVEWRQLRQYWLDILSGYKVAIPADLL